MRRPFGAAVLLAGALALAACSEESPEREELTRPGEAEAVPIEPEGPPEGVLDPAEVEDEWVEDEVEEPEEDAPM